MEEGKDRKKGSSLPGSFTVGAIALVFLIIGYQAAVFIHHAATVKLAADRDRPDTVYVIDSALAKTVISSGAGGGVEKSGGKVVVRKNAPRSEYAVAAREKAVPRRVESFRFNPNTVSLEDLKRLGFSEKQAQAIDNYRQKGGRFRRPGDFAKSYVVSDSVFARLEKYIDIPKIDINKADSTALLDLPGIGPWFAGRIVSYRKALGGYNSMDQLLEIKNFSQERYDGLKDLIVLSKPQPYPLWTLPEEELKKHPYISGAEAHGIVLYRNHNKKEALSVDGLLKAGVISEEHAGKLGRCSIAPLAEEVQ
ncbi:MAG: helix-hairpin-helix domain-containing protein [Bacteroidales bacterium]|nr:helix-hairpin-helix domain-containing protein [Bacteroidales bacterium]